MEGIKGIVCLFVCFVRVRERERERMVGVMKEEEKKWYWGRGVWVEVVMKVGTHLSVPCFLSRSFSLLKFNPLPSIVVVVVVSDALLSWSSALPFSSLSFPFLSCPFL